MWLVLFLLGFSLIAVYLYYYHYYQPYVVVRKFIGLPGPAPSIFFGNLRSIMKDPECKKRWEKQYGSTYLYYLGIRPVIYTGDPQLARTVLIEKCSHFMLRRDVAPVFGSFGKSLIYAKPDDWHRMRRLLSPMFSTKKLKTVAPLIDGCCSRLLARLTVSTNDSEIVDVYNCFGDYSMEVILSVAFGRELHSDTSEGKRLKDCLSAFLTASRESPSWGFAAITTLHSHTKWLVYLMRFLAKYKQAKTFESWKYLYEISESIVKDRRSHSTERKDILQMMVDAEDDQATNSKRTGLSDKEIVANSVLFIVAGFDTTRTTMSYVAYQLARHDDVQDRVIDELQQVFANDPQCSLYDAAEQMDYLEMVILETIRLCNVVLELPRTCSDTCVISDKLVIPKGTSLDFRTSSVHLDSKSWPNPNTFDPERFGPDPKVAHSSSGAYLAFSAGPKACIGKRLGISVTKMGLIAVLKKFRFSIAPDCNVEFLLHTGLSFPKNGVNLKLVPQ